MEFVTTIYPGIKCESQSAFLSSSCCQKDSEFSLIGELMDPKLRGSYYLNTFSQSVYAMPPVNATSCIYVKNVDSLTESDIFFKWRKTESSAAL